MKRDRVCCFYCQHSVGLGHLVRSMHLADGLARGLRCHAPQRRTVARPSSRSPTTIEVVHLPALGLDADYALVSRDERFTVEEAVRLRRSMILERLPARRRPTW